MKSPEITLTALSETLAFILPKTWRSTREVHSCIAEIYPYAKTTKRAVANRLQRMKALGLVVCRRAGKEKHWRRT